MFGRRQSTHTLGERGILGDDGAAEVLASIDALRVEIGQLKQRVDSQFTTIAAHTEIARNHAELVRNEAKSDLGRSRETLISLIEQVRSEGVRAPGSAPGASGAVVMERFGEVEGRLVELDSRVERCLTRQNELADTMAAPRHRSCGAAGGACCWVEFGMRLGALSRGVSACARHPTVSSDQGVLKPTHPSCARHLLTGSLLTALSD